MKLLIYQALMRVLSLFPLRVIHACGAGLGWLGGRIPNQMLSVSRVNVDLCFPGQSAEWRHDTLHQSLEHTGRVFTEVAALWHWPAERVDALVRERHGWEHIQRALDAGRGLIVLSPHTGSWELAGQYISRRAPVTLMYRPPRDSAFETRMVEIRERAGARLVPTSAGGVRTLYKTLEAGEVIGLLPDQAPRRGSGVFAPLFGLPAYTMLLVSRLARKHHTPAIVATARRRPHGGGFDLHIVPVSDALYDADDEVSAGALNEAVETIIRLDPSQYMWCYKRFALTPEGKRSYD